MSGAATAMFTGPRSVCSDERSAALSSSAAMSGAEARWSSGGGRGEQPGVVGDDPGDPGVAQVADEAAVVDRPREQLPAALPEPVGERAVDDAVEGHHGVE